jgi:hypothetical protein
MTNLSTRNKQLEAEVRDLLEALDFCRRTVHSLHTRSWSSGWMRGGCLHMLDNILDRPEAQAILNKPKRRYRRNGMDRVRGSHP